MVFSSAPYCSTYIFKACFSIKNWPKFICSIFHECFTCSKNFDSWQNSRVLSAQNIINVSHISLNYLFDYVVLFFIDKLELFSTWFHPTFVSNKLFQKKFLPPKRLHLEHRVRLNFGCNMSQSNKPNTIERWLVS